MWGTHFECHQLAGKRCRKRAPAGADASVRRGRVHAGRNSIAVSNAKTCTRAHSTAAEAEAGFCTHKRKAVPTLAHNMLTRGRG
jgi:hypothetical protein